MDRRSNSMNPYEVLGVCRDDTDDEIKVVYRRLVKKWHSDNFHTEVEIQNAEMKIKEINEAYEMLKTPEKRANYDMANPVSENVYEYYAKKKTEDVKKTKDSTDIEMEKQRKAVVQFLDVEYEHKQEILDTFQELETGVVNDEFSEEEYSEYLELIIDELKDCVYKIQKIVSVAKAKGITGLNASFGQAQNVIDELIQKERDIPKSLEKAHYVEETRLLAEKINDFMNGFRDRVNEITWFDLLDKTWEFENDDQLNLARKTHKKKVKKLLKDMKWVQETSLERNIQLEPICFGASDAEYEFQREEKSLDKCIEIVEENRKVLNLNLEKLREKFWKERCGYMNSRGKKLLDGFKNGMEEAYEGNFICPPSTVIGYSYALAYLENITCITIPDYAIDGNCNIELPGENLKKLVFIFGEISHTVDISRMDYRIITREGEYICVKENVARAGRYSFVFVNNKKVYNYDIKKLYKLNGVTSVEELSEIWKEYKASKGYYMQVHTWAQVVKKLPDCRIMQVIPCSTQLIKVWKRIDKTNFEKAFLKAGDLERQDNFKKAFLGEIDDLTTRVIRLYIALGALKEGFCHERAESLISKFDISKMYRSRLERFPREMPDEDPVFSVPEWAVNLVQENIDNEEFLPYVLAFLEGYKLFISEARKAQVEISTEFIICTAPQYIFHKKVENSVSFKKQLLEVEKNFYDDIPDKILNLYNVRSKKKNIIETVDECDLTMHYRFFDIEDLESYLLFAYEFKRRFRQSLHYYRVETDNIFVSPNTHAIEIIDDEKKRVAVVILNLFDKGELFADVIGGVQTVEVLETVKRALIDQMNCNSRIKALSIGMNEAPRTSKYNFWREAVKEATSDWLQDVEWIKFEVNFESRILGTSYKGYRARFIIQGIGQYFDKPNPYNRYRRKNRYQEWW